MSKQYDHAVIVDKHAHSTLLKPNSQLDHALSNSKANGLPDIAISPLQGQFLTVQCKLINAKSVLEIGTLGGYSTICLASSGAKVTSLEIDPKHRDVALENTKGFDVDIILGAALDTLPKLADEGRKFDFVFIDAAWEEQDKYFDWAVKLTRKGGCIYMDNVVRELLEHENPGSKNSVVEVVGRDERVTATLVPTFSSHKTTVDDAYDGFILAVVN